MQESCLTTQARTAMIEAFQADCLEHRQAKQAACPVMILSLKAGGVGLNLMAANRVIHYFDRWWNPAVEDQASDRVHRIGQKNTVFVHTFSSYGTIEESIAAMMDEKRELASDLLGNAKTGSTAEILRDDKNFRKFVDPRSLFLRGN